MSETFLVLERAVQADLDTIARLYNHVDEAAGWHAQLLRRMRLDLTPVRPALIDESAYEKLDELRRFRHLFRSAYGIQLDAERLRLVLRKAVQLRRIYLPQMESFLEFVRAVRQ